MNGGAVSGWSNGHGPLLLFIMTKFYFFLGIMTKYLYTYTEMRKLYYHTLNTIKKETNANNDPKNTLRNKKI